jgi:hypothetical protein
MRILITGGGGFIGAREDICEGDLRRVFPDLPSTSLRNGVRRSIELYTANA